MGSKRMSILIGQLKGLHLKNNAQEVCQLNAGKKSDLNTLPQAGISIPITLDPLFQMLKKFQLLEMREKAIQAMFGQWFAMVTFGGEMILLCSSMLMQVFSLEHQDTLTDVQFMDKWKSLDYQCQIAQQNGRLQKVYTFIPLILIQRKKATTNFSWN